jgi:mannose-6-phosphate isomerase-like protein (cupin superfamily)
MIHQSLDKTPAKGWFIGPWNSDVPIPIGYANQGIDEQHYHARVFEIYLVAHGTSTAVVNQQSIQLQAGDMLVVEPGETHTFSHSSDDYFHFVIQTPFVPGDKIQEDDKK